MNPLMANHTTHIWGAEEVGNLRTLKLPRFQLPASSPSAKHDTQVETLERSNLRMQRSRAHATPQVNGSSTAYPTKTEVSRLEQRFKRCPLLI